MIYERMSNEPKASFSDAVQLNDVHIDHEYTASFEYEDHPNEDAYGPIGERGVELEYSTTVESVATLHAKKHLADQLHERNQSEWSEVDVPNDGSALYDLALLNVMDTVFEAEDLSIPESGPSNRRVKIAYLEKARRVTNQKQFYRHLKGNPEVCTAVGYDDTGELPSYSTIRRIQPDILPEVYDESPRFEERFSDAIVRAVYAVYRNGVVPPEAVREGFGLDPSSPAVSDSTISRQKERQALRNWVRFLADETLGPLTFDREDPEYDMLHFLGLLATSALTDSSLETAANVSLWDHGYNHVPKGTGVPKYIANDLPGIGPLSEYTDSDAPTIDAQFDAVHEQFLSVAEDFGFFADPVPVAVDIHEVEWTGGEAPTISRYNKRMNDVTEEWPFVIASIIDNTARFTLGARFLRTKSGYPEKVREILPGPPDHFDISTAFGDAEMVPGELMTNFESIVTEDWIIKAPARAPVKRLKGFTPRGYMSYAENVKAGAGKKPNLVAYPKDTHNPTVVEVQAAEIESPSIDEDDITKYKTSSEDGAVTRSFDDFGGNSTPEEGEDSSPTADFPLPSLAEEFSDPASMTGVGAMTSHATYFTSRSLSDSSFTAIYSDYFQRWAIEQSINEISNRFLPVLGGADPKVRLYGINVAIVLQNWYAMINRARSPEVGLRLDVTPTDVLKAVQHVAFDSARESLDEM